MTCFICGSGDWIELKGMHSQSLMVVCKACGCLAHHVEASYEKDILEYYRKEYRKVPNHINIHTTTNKLFYIEEFLREYLEGKRGLVCGDVGAATGYLLSWLKRLGHKVTGSEYTVSFRRVSEHFYGIPLTEELRRDRAYDFISIYHVLEHMVEPDKKLASYVELLKDDGHMLVSTPFWLEGLVDASGQDASTFDNLFHKNHINLFTKNHLQNLFRKCGLYWTKNNYKHYGQTYLLKKGDKKPIEPEDWQRVVDILKRQKGAFDFYGRGNFSEAIKLWYDFPEAHVRLITQTYGKDQERQSDMWDALGPELKSNFRVMCARLGWLIQQQRYEDGLSLGQEIMSLKPNGDTINNMAICLARLKRHGEAMQLFSEVARRSPMTWISMTDMSLWCAAQMPAWDERAREEAKSILFDNALKAGAVKITLEDEANADGKNPEKEKGALSVQRMVPGVSGIGDGCFGAGVSEVQGHRAETQRQGAGEDNGLGGAKAENPVPGDGDGTPVDQLSVGQGNAAVRQGSDSA